MKKYRGLLATLMFCSALPFGVSAQGIPNLPAAADAPVEEGSSDSGSDSGSSDRRLYVSPMFSYTWADKDRNVGNGYGGIMSIGKKMTSGLNLELTGFYSSMDTGFDETTKFTGFGAGAMVFPLHSYPEIFGIVALHQGQAKDHPSEPFAANFSYKTTVFDTGVGYLLPLNQWLGGYDMSLRAEARYRYDAHTRTDAGRGGKKDFYEGVFNVGVLIPLGKLPIAASAEAPVEVVQPAVTDADGDGIPDDQDQCPDTAAGVTVNEKGCEGDADGDGVVDRLDNCPDTAAGTAVNEQGCAAVKDSDGDGVADDKDQCPDTAAGTTVNETGCAPKPAGCRAPAPGEPINLEGCATGESVVLKGVNFEVNSARLTANAKVILNQVADSLTANPAIKVEIGGHTDSSGSAKLNEKLSQKRAQSVKDYLAKRGISADRMTAKGYGPSQPVDTNETPEGKELNRRVELKVLQAGGQ